MTAGRLSIQIIYQRTFEMTIAFLSDTHGKHRDENMPQADVLIHAGDLSWNGTEEDHRFYQLAQPAGLQA